MRAKKLLCIGNYLNTSGAPLDAILIAEEAQKLGWHAEAWFICATGEAPTSQVPVRVFADHKPRTPWGWLALLGKFYVALLRSNTTRVVSYYPLTNVMGALTKPWGGFSFAATQRNPAHAQNPFVKLLDLVVGCTSLYTDNIVISHAVEKSFAHYPGAYRRRLKLVYNGLPPLAQGNLNQVNARQALGLPVKAWLLGNLGRLHAQKNLPLLLETLCLLPDAHLALAGEGPERASLTAQASQLGLTERVHFLGTLQGTEVSVFYQAIDIFAMPSSFEGFGRTLLEAMSQGVPVVASPLPVLQEVGGGAAVHPSMTPSAWAEALHLAQANRAKLSQRGRERSQHFSMAAMVTGYLS